MKVLILKPSSLGDVVHALPVLRHIKRAHPLAEIYWWVDSALAPLLEGDPDLAGVVRFERRRWVSPRYWPELVRSIRWLRAQRFDWVIDLQSLARSGAFAWLTDGRLLIGLDEAREGARGFYDIIVRRSSYGTHAVDWYLGVLPKLGIQMCPDFQWMPERKEVRAALIDRWSKGRGRCIILQPGARWITKRWPVGHFKALAELIVQELPGYYVSVLGGRDDFELGEQIVKASPERCLNLAGKLNLQEMVEWIRQSELMVSNDTGPMHVAAALGKTVVAIFGPTNSGRTGPYGQVDLVLRHNLQCAPCMKKRCLHIKPMECMEAISPQAVFSAIKDRLGLSSKRSVEDLPGTASRLH